MIGVWGAASRQRALIREFGGITAEFGTWVQISRLGNPLFNEVIVPMGKKDLWNSLTPADDKRFLQVRPASGAGRAAARSCIRTECSPTSRV